MKRLKNGILPICLSLLITFLAPMSLALAAEMAANEGAAGDNTMTRVALLDDDMSEIEINTVLDAEQNPKEGNRFEQGLLWWTAWGFDVFKTSAAEPKGMSVKFADTGKKLYKKAFLTPINRGSDFAFEYSIHTASRVENGADVFAVINNKAVNNGDSDFPLWKYSSASGKLSLLGTYVEDWGKLHIEETEVNTFQLVKNKPYNIKVDFKFNGYTSAGVDKYTTTVTISDENGDVIGTYSKDDWIDNIYCKGQYALSDIIERFGFAIYDGTPVPENPPTLLTVSHVKVTEDVPNFLIADKAVSQFGLSTSYNTLFYDPEKAVAIGDENAWADFDNGKVWAYGLAKGWDDWGNPGPEDVVTEYKNCFVPENGYIWINSRPTITSAGYKHYTQAALLRAFSPVKQGETLSASVKIRLAKSDQSRVGASVRLAKSQFLKANERNHNNTLTLLSYIHDNSPSDKKYGDLFFVGGVRDEFGCWEEKYNGAYQTAPETGNLYPFKLDGDAQNQELEVVLTAEPENADASTYKVTTVLKSNAGTELIKCEKPGVEAHWITDLDCIELTSGSQNTDTNITAEPIMGVKDIRIAHGGSSNLNTPQAELKSGSNSLYVPYINESGSDCKVVLLAAVYEKGSNMLKQCVPVDCPSIGVSGALKADVDIADLETEYVKLFIFDSLDSLHPVSRPIQLGSE